MIKKTTNKKKSLIVNSAESIIANMLLQFIMKAKVPHTENQEAIHHLDISWTNVIVNRPLSNACSSFDVHRKRYNTVNTEETTPTEKSKFQGDNYDT